jgi:hypothetical protein
MSWVRIPSLTPIRPQVNGRDLGRGAADDGAAFTPFPGDESGHRDGRPGKPSPRPGARPTVLGLAYPLPGHPADKVVATFQHRRACGIATRWSG